MKRRGFRAMAAFSVQMPNVYTFMRGFDVDPQPVEQRKLREAVPRLEMIARKIAAGEPCPDDVVPGAFAWFKSGVIRPWFERTQMSPKHFTVDLLKCVRCGKCMRDCPLGNIAASAEHTPLWGPQCMLCERCYHGCPVHAIDYRGTSAGKGRYICPDSL